MFIFGSTLVFGIGTEAGQDIWISQLFAIAFTIPAVLMFARIMKLFPGKNLFEIIDELFGKIFGKVLIVLLVWYALHLSASVLRNFTDFIQVTTMPETPQLPVAIMLLAPILYLARCRTGVFGKWSVVTFVIISTIILFTILLSIEAMDWNNILPVMEHDMGTLLNSSYQLFTLPLGETFLFLGIADSLKKGDSPYKAYLYGILFIGFSSLLILPRNVLVLGPGMMEVTYYPSFAVGRIINPGDFFARIENMLSMNYIFTGITKITLCIVFVVKGIASLFKIPEYRKILAPICLLCLALSIISYHSVMDLFDFVKRYYPIYTIPFQILIPLLIWITAEIKKSRKKASFHEEPI